MGFPLPFVFDVKRHAVLIICHQFPEICENTLKLLDNKDIDFYIHVDKKSNIDDFLFLKNVTKESNVYFIPRISVNWGGESQIKAELNILEYALKKEYSYLHLISGSDMPLVRAKEFLSFFDENYGCEFIHFSDGEFSENAESRMKYYYPFQDIRLLNKSEKLKNLFLFIQKKLGVNRLKKYPCQVYIGSNWFSITSSLAEYLVLQKKEILKRFRYTLCCDEVFLQTIVKNSKFSDNLYKNGDYPSNLRYIDWKRGNPYSFRECDIEELLNAKAIFARKFTLNDSDKTTKILTQRIINK